MNASAWLLLQGISKALNAQFYNDGFFFESAEELRHAELDTAQWGHGKMLMTLQTRHCEGVSDPDESGEECD